MPKYRYEARDVSGKLVKGTMKAASKEALIARLHRMGYLAVGADESIGGIKVVSLFADFYGISADSMVIFNIQLASMINSGITILDSLRALSEQIDDKKFKVIIEGIGRSVESGSSFSEALAQEPRVFSKLFVNMVKSGEASGKLGIVLDRFAKFIEYQADLRQKIKGALFYPALLLAAGVAVTLLIVTFIIPQFVDIFSKSGIKVPLPTVILFNIGMAIKRFWHTFILCGILVYLLISYYGNTGAGRYRFDRLKLRLPFIGALYLRAAISRFSRTLATLLSSGVPVLLALEITRDVVGNEALGRVIANLREAVEKGEGMAETLKVGREFPADSIQMIAVGERTGNLDAMLDKVSGLYDLRIGYAIKKLTTILEPVLLVIMGCMVGFIMASLLLPIFDMIQILRR
ncbi:MAG: hypothetical protein COV72_04640 [Candidatus Omnitrophica bacterium CG11_big_fil_rev_8_21_14_0_20_42_13]|uniref:Type II secretion system protein GspF domain-containing protein n=1 Tax=Candidatus Ghiorseimicrobium undicola TaxID=1974746 RepID=A0A2H0M025_9BACT|nr:MAG: hypothetical protein COV72_04640 [Candidatus Omnitrophica bacterium CG11_big_fil_rev_8_21_14_0_20_42_13]